MNFIRHLKNFLVSRFTHPSDDQEGPYYYYHPPRQPLRPFLPIVLFGLTVISTLFVGAAMEGVDPTAGWTNLAKGVPFSFTLIFILGVHEFGHYFYSRKWGVDVTLPYFIPAPTAIGTMGAIIKMRGPIPSRTALLEIGAAGPLAGFVAAIPVIISGLSHSAVVQVASVDKASVTMGDSLLFKLLSRIIIGDIPAGADVFLTPVAFSGWIGMFVTMLNLLPLGQLDGGHIAYSVLGKKFKYVTWAFIGLMIVMGFAWYGWWVWAGLITILVGLRHPRPMDNSTPLSPQHKVLAVFMFLIFIVTFIPVPFKF